MIFQTLFLAFLNYAIVNSRKLLFACACISKEKKEESEAEENVVKKKKSNNLRTNIEKI